MPPTLSQLLLDEIDRLDEECLDELPIEQRSQSDEANKITDLVTRALLRSRTGMATHK